MFTHYFKGVEYIAAGSEDSY